MGKFIVHGIVLEEPKRSNTSSGMDCVSLLIEEKTQTAFKEIVNVYSLDFIGKNANCVPTSIRLTGAPVVAMGTINSREYKGRYYNDLRGESLTIISVKSFTNEEITQKDVEDFSEKEDDTVDLPEDDLPF